MIRGASFGAPCVANGRKRKPLRAWKLFHAFFYELVIAMCKCVANVEELFIGHARIQRQRDFVREMRVRVRVIFDVEA